MTARHRPTAIQIGKIQIANGNAWFGMYLIELKNDMVVGLVLKSISPESKKA